MTIAANRTTAADKWTIIVPVKSLDRAKSRLGSTLSPQSRRELVLAMATDVITSCLRTPQVAAVRVVSADPRVAELAELLGAEHVAEPAQELGDSRPPLALAMNDDPLNIAVASALTGVSGPVGVVTADLPELGAELLTHILASASLHAHSVVTDHHGQGTTMAFWTGLADRVCRFGPDSATSFRIEGGAAPITLTNLQMEAASRDVDIPADLTRLRGRRVGNATSRILHGGTSPLACANKSESVTMVR